MKKILLLFLLLMIHASIFAPATNHLVITTSAPVNIYERLMDAIVMVESGGDTLAYNALEEAYGPFQIRPIRLTDYNKKTGKKYRMRDCYRMSVSREIFLFYVDGRDFEVVAKSWNGSGPMTIDYWNKVKKYL
jgi:hypothetical protein